MRRGNHCQCKDCRKAWKKDKILGDYLQRFLGGNAWKVSAYVKRPNVIRKIREKVSA